MAERIETRAHLEPDEERYRMLVEHVSDWIWEVDENGVYTYASPRIYDILGYSPAEVLGKTPFDLMEPEEAKRIAPIFEYHVANKLPFKSLENINLHRDGYEVILETSGAPIINAEGMCVGFRGIDRDITLRKQIERRQKQLLEILEASPAFIATLDLQGNSLYYNPTARKMLGIEQEHPFNESLTDRWLSDVIKSEGIPAAIDNGHWKGESTIVVEDGTKIPVSQMVVAHKSENGQVEFLSTIAHDITDRKELEKVIYDQAHYDTLTNLPNRRFLQKRFLEIIEKPAESAKTAILFLDLDHFKEINDTLGHEIGDQLLKLTAAQLVNCVEDSDIVCRYGGDEFILVVENIEDEAHIQQKAEQIIESLQEPFQIGQHLVRVTGSMGISIYPDDGTDLTTLIHKADHAMYFIKRNGKNSFSRNSY